MSDYIPEGAQIILSTQGLEIWRNPVNSFVVARVHHTADPHKRSETWKKVAVAGMSPGKAAREYDIDYNAVQGSKVFPEFSERRSEIVCPPLSDLTNLRCWAGLDYGTRNPSSVHVYTILDGVTYAIWELYEPCKNIPEFAAKIRACPYWSLVRYVAADPSLWIPTQQQAWGPPVGVSTLLQQAGLSNLIKGRADAGSEGAWLAMLRKHWQSESPTFKITTDCPAMIREFEGAIFTPQSERQRLNADWKETINNKDNHALDDCKYFMLSQPVEGRSGNGPGWSDPGQVYKLLGKGWNTSSGPSRRPY